MPGFNSQIFLAPGDGVGVMAFTNGSRNASGWLTGEQRLLRKLIGAPRKASAPTSRSTWRSGPTLRVVPAPRPADRHDGVERIRRRSKITVRRGQLILRTLSPIPALYRGLQLHPDDQVDPYVFPNRPLEVRPGHGQGGVQLRPFRHGDWVHIDGLLLSAEKHPGRPHGRAYAKRPT